MHEMIANVFWQVNGGTAIGAASVTVGTIISSADITVGPGSTVVGRCLTYGGKVFTANVNIITA